MSQPDPIIGIDLGTTNSVVAVLENDQPKVIVNREGSTRTPSVVSFLDNGEVVVGDIAKRQSAVRPERTVSSMKRLMGRRQQDIEGLGLTFPFEIATHDNELMIRVGEEGYTPSQVSAFVLQKLKAAAEDYLGGVVSKAIITVPAYFDDLQRQATFEAGRLAGLEVLRLLNEPTAAAMAYGLGRGEEERVAVYDFGGGTFDLTILDIAENTFEVITTMGDTHLGGDDIDQIIVEHLVSEFARNSGQELVMDPIMLRRLMDAAEKAKCELSIARQTAIHLPFLGYADGKPIHMEATLTRDKLESLILPLIGRTIAICRRALEDCELTVSHIDKVILVGGSTRIPFVQDLVEDFFATTPFRGVNPDEIVAMGAAAQAGVLAGKLKEVLLLDVTPHSLGVEVEDNRVSRVVEKNSTIPIKAARLFTTTEDQQEVVLVHVLQGESEKASENRSLGKFSLTGLQEAGAGIPRIQVTFHINADGMVEVSAEDLQTRQQKAVSLTIGGDDQTASATPRRPRRRKRRERTESAEIIASPSPTAVSLAAPAPKLVVQRDNAPTAFQPVVPDSAHAMQPVNLHGDSGTGMRRSHLPEDLSPQARQAVRCIRKVDASGSAYEMYSNAAEELSHYVETRPHEPSLLDAVLRILVVTGRMFQARKALFSAHNEQTQPMETTELHEILQQDFANERASAAARVEALRALGLLDVAIAAYERRMPEDTHIPFEHTDELIAMYEMRLAEHPDPNMQFNLVKMLLRSDRTDDAIENLQQLAEQPQYQMRAFRILGLCFWQKGMHYLAWQKLQLLPLDDDVKDILYRLATDMEDTDQLLNAKLVLQHLAQADSGFRDVQARLRRVEQLIAFHAHETESHTTPTTFLQSNDPRFTVQEEINRGSMGIVYKAYDTVLDETVALKVLNDYLVADPNAVERFKREARAARRLSHPNIVRIHDLFDYGTKKMLSMEYIDGRDLKTILRERGPLSPEETIEILYSVCDALAYAHSNGVVHRDVKPANIMITGRKEVKVTDFGIAKMLLLPEATQSGSQILGTPLYMSPEQISGDPIDPRADIYSLGAMVYEMVSGKPPFREGNIEYHHLHTPPAPLPKTVPAPLGEIAMKCLAKAPENRFQSVAEVHTALTAAAEALAAANGGETS